MRSNPADDASIDVQAVGEHEMHPHIELDRGVPGKNSRTSVESPRLFTRTLPALLVQLQNSRRLRR